MTELMLETQENHCCVVWRELTHSIKVNPFNKINPADIIFSGKK